MALVRPTVTQIRDQMLRDYGLLIPDAQVGEGSDYWATATLWANVLSPVYANGDFLGKQGDPATADETVGLPILAKTYGCLIFQEQVVQVIAALLCCSDAEADQMRKRLAKHDRAGTMDQARAEFIGGACRRIASPAPSWPITQTRTEAVLGVKLPR